MSNEKMIHPVVCFGETLWDMFPTGKQPGGAPMNVAYHLQKLGKQPAIISRVGNDALGKELLQVFQTKNVCTTYVQLDDNKPTSVVTATAKNNQEMVYTIVEDVAWDYIELDKQNITVAENSLYFVFGTLAARNEKSLNTLLALLEAANKKVLDVNLRTPFYNPSLLETLLNKSNIVKLNIDELRLLSAWYGGNNYSSEDQVKLLKEKFLLESVIVTCGANGAILNKHDEWRFCEGLDIVVADTVGSGDSFLAGILSQFIDDASIQDALDFANTLAAFVATQQGACPDYSMDIHSQNKNYHINHNQHFNHLAKAY